MASLPPTVALGLRLGLDLGSVLGPEVVPELVAKLVAELVAGLEVELGLVAHGLSMRRKLSSVMANATQHTKRWSSSDPLVELPSSWSCDSSLCHDASVATSTAVRASSTPANANMYPVFRPAARIEASVEASIPRRG